MASIVCRLGNKSRELHKFIDYVPIDSNMLYVEPFAGSFALCRHLYKLNKNLKFHINDNDTELFNIYTKIEEYRNEVNRFLQYFRQLEYYVRKDKLKEYTFINNEFKEAIIKTYVVRGYIIKVSNKDVNDQSTIDILNKSRVTCLDYMEVLNEYRDNEKAFIFLDPPYLFCNNSSYQKQHGERTEMDNSDMIINILEFMKSCACKCLLIVNDLKIIRMLYKDMIKDTYDVVYQISKRKSKHLIITNY
jgi:site-specific DNA-adenine methylase